MSRSEYMSDYRARKASGNYVDKRKKEKIIDPCLNCGKELVRGRPGRPRKFCSNEKCQHEYARKTAIDLGIAGFGSTKRHLIETRGYKCETCGISEWQNKSIVLEMDHINGISTDHSLENVRLLCPNCHSQTDTYKSRNVGKAVARNVSKPFYPTLLDQHLPSNTGRGP